MKWVIKTQLFLLMMSCAAWAEGQTVVNPNVEAVIQSFVEKNSFSGVVLVQDGENIVHLKSYGMAVREHQVPNQLDSIFRIGSLSKQFVAAQIMSLQEQGILSVEDALSQYFQIPNHWRGIRLRHLLTHTAGLKADLPMNQDPKQMGAYHSPAELMKAAMAVPLEYNTIRERHYHYSNIGYLLLTLVLRKVLGSEYHDIVAKFGKTVDLPSLAEDHDSLVTPKMSQGYLQLPGDQGRQSGFDVLNFLGAGDLRSNMQDLSNWVDILLENRFLSEKSKQEMWTPQASLQSSIEGEKLGYGYGWLISRYKDRLKVFHNGSLPGFTADLAIWPNEKKRVIVLCNLRENIWNANKTSMVSLVNATLVREQIEKVLFEKPSSELCESDLTPKQ